MKNYSDVTSRILTFFSLHINRRFPTPEDCLAAAKFMVATQISREPAVRKCIRQTYFERAKICVLPTKKGIKVCR